MISFEQRKSVRGDGNEAAAAPERYHPALPPKSLPKCGETGETGEANSQEPDLSVKILSHPAECHGETGETTEWRPIEPVFERFALRYARQGFEVFPLAPDSKKPTKGSHGLSDATSDTAQVEEWRREFPCANIGLRTGPGSGICAVDLDPLKGGFETERLLRSEGKTWPETPLQRTRSGGRHIILQYHPLLVTGSNRLGPGIDFRGAGGYIVAAPSVVEGKRYSWLCWPPAGPAPVPAWLVNDLAAEAAKKRADKPEAPQNNPVVLEPALERARKALCFIPSDDRDTWLTVGMALAGSFGDSAKGLWDEWSKQSSKFNAHEQVKAWRSFRGAGRTVGTIFWLRRQYRGRSQIYSLY